MSELTISSERLTAFAAHLRAEERSPGTIENYLRHIRAFAVWLDGSPVTKETAAAWKEHLLTQDYAPATVNAMLAALNGLFHFLGWDGCRVKFLRVQRRLFRDAGRELTRPEYERLMETARSRGQERLALLMETICATGIRVSEVQYITMEAAKRGRTDIFLKGKIRTILLPEKLCRKLLKYAQKHKMKQLCRYAGVEPGKVFPHNFRHLFATIFYRACKDIVRLADVLGHSSIETTRIYLTTSGAEHAQQLNRLGLIL